MTDLDLRIANLSPTKRALLEKKLQQRAIATQPKPTLPRAQPTAREAIPLSFSQQRMWLLDRLEPGNPAYNRPANLVLSGYLDRQVLAQSLQEILHRHEVLRAKFLVIDGQPVQSIEPFATLDLPFVNLADLADLDRDLDLQELVIRSAHCCFDLERDLLIKATLVRISELDRVLLITFHHIIFDGWSMGIFTQELSTIYRAFIAKKSSPLPELTSQYSDFVFWQQQQLNATRLQPHLTYWQDRLGGNLPILELPADYPRPPIQTYRGAKHTLYLNNALSDALKDLSQQADATLFMLLLAAFKTLLYRYTGETDLLVGCPIAGRDRVETESLIGVFINTLVFRTQLDPEIGFSELLARVRQVSLAAYAHQELPFEKIIEALKPERDLSHSPLFQVLFQVRNLPKHSSIVSAIEIAEYDCDPKIAAFDLTLDISVGITGLECVFTYNTDLFAAGTIERMAGHFQTLLTGIVADPYQPISQLPLITATERQQLLWDWNDTRREYPDDTCIHHLFERQAAITPDAIAIEFADLQLTYRELNNRSNQLAHHLQNLGVKPDVLVGIYIERSLEMVVGLLGILKAGGAYVPLDPSYPVARLSYMVADAGVEVLLTQQALLSSLPSTATRVICLDTDWAQIERQDPTNLPPQSASTDLAYTIYTSGSTGKPKGVQICHRSIVNFVDSMRRQPGLTASDTLLSVTTISFDIAVLELSGNRQGWGQALATTHRVTSHGDASYAHNLATTPRRWLVG
jgi:Condensation domain/AMP-binding enzyme